LIIKLKRYWDELEREIMFSNLTEIVMEGLRLLIPPKLQQIWEWGEENIELDSTTAIPGPFRIINSPHIKRLFFACLDPRVRQITIVGSVQIGKTLFMLIDWAFTVCNIPMGMMMMQPTKKDATTFIKTKLDPFIDNNEIVRKKVRSKKKKGTNDTVDSTADLKMFSGGWTEIIHGGSKGATRGRSPQKTYGDDITAIQTDIRSEGDPAKRLENRTKAYKNTSKNINISQPGLVDSCNITSRYELGSQEEYHVKCLECGEYQVLDDDLVVWDQDKDVFGKVIKDYPETAKIPCKFCGTLFSESDRIKMLQNAMDNCEEGFIFGYKAKYPEMVTHISVQIGQASSTLSNLEKIVNERIAMEKAGTDEAKQDYWNTVKGRAYRRGITKETDPLVLIDRNRSNYIDLKDYKIPNDVLLITCAIDVQKGSEKKTENEKPENSFNIKEARIEYEYWGWGIGEQGWILDKGTFPGNITDLKDVWKKFDDYYEKKKFVREDGIELKVTRVFVDSGHESDTVYKYVEDKQHFGFFAIKGSNQYDAEMLSRNVKPVEGDTVFKITLGTQKIKHTIYTRLNDIIDKGDKFLNFADVYCNRDYFDQLTAERMHVKIVGNNTYFYYKKKKDKLPNEALDLLVYNFAALKHCLPKFNAIKEDLEKIKKEREVKSEEAEQEETQNINYTPRKPKDNYTVDGWNN